MPDFESRLRAAVLVVTTVVSWTMLLEQVRQADARTQTAVSRVELARLVRAMPSTIAPALR